MNDHNDATPAQNINISGATLSGVQIGGIAGKDLTLEQSQTVEQTHESTSLEIVDVVEYLNQLKDIVSRLELSPASRDKIFRNIDGAQDEIQADKPDKPFAVKQLQRAAQVLKKASEETSLGGDWITQINSIFKTISPWLEATAAALML